MIMDLQALLNIILGGALSVCGWFLRQMWDAVKSLKEDIQKIEIDLPTHYVRKDDMEARFDRIEALLDKLFEKIDKKADR